MSALSDPWRLCCPKCRNHGLKSLSQEGWRCQHCKETMPKLHDKKRDRLVSRQELTA